MPLPPNPNIFANSPLDRAGHRRRDEVWLAAALDAPNARLALFHRLQPFLLDESQTRVAGWMGGHARSLCANGAAALFLGVDAEGAAHFAAELPDDLEGFALAEMGGFEEMRAAAMILPPSDTAILGCAKAVFEWHRNNGYCANCSNPTRIIETGWKRYCDACKREHYPRVDPVVIMLPVLGEKCLLGRQARFPRGMHSALAGFVEPGESIEEAVARETLEEAGLVVSSVRYHSTQPWPFPHSLMIGAIAKVTHDQVTVDEEELESARWFTREEAKLLVEGKHADAFAPPPIAIAHHLLKAWAFE